jgi:tryptophan synthase alpha chain
VSGSVTPGALERRLRDARDAGRKLLVPYVTGGLGDDWTDVISAIAAAGADAVEVGIPFSDPVMDGPTIQQASQLALAAGATPEGIIASLGRLDAGIPVAVMTYYNIVFRAGHRRFARSLATSGVAGAIVPDAPLDELGDWTRAADDAGVETVLLASPLTGDDRLAAICARSRGFVYGISRLGVTGERDSIAGSASVIAKRLKAVTDLPVLIGIGVTTPSQAVDVSIEADGVIVGSALIRKLLDGGGPDGAAAFIGEMRAALDEAYG